MGVSTTTRSKQRSSGGGNGRKRGDSALWLNRVQAAELCGLSSRQFDAAVRPLAENAEKGSGQNLRFWAPAIVAALVNKRVAEGMADPEAALIAAGSRDSESPALERWRAAKARIAEVDADERESQVIPKAELETGLGLLVSTLRNAADQLVREYGNEAGTLLGEALDEFEAACQRQLGEEETNERHAESGDRA